MRIFLLFICIFCTVVGVLGDDLFVATYGATPNDDLMDTKGINAALYAASKTPNSRVIFTSGTYRINGTLSLPSGKNITLEGNGATIIGTTPVNAFLISSVDGFVLRNLILDWDPVPFTAGRVINSSRWSVDIEVAEGHVASNRTCREITKYNRTNHHWIANTVWQQRNSNLPSILLNSTTMRIPWDVAGGGGYSGTYFTVGSDLICRHYVYEGPALITTVCKNVLIDNFVIYAAPGMGITAKHTTNLTVTNSQVTPRKPRWVSTTADGSHILNMRGKLTVTNTVIEGMGDDCMNIHNDYLHVTSVNPTYAILGLGVALGMDLIFANDTIGFSTTLDPFNYFIKKTVISNARDFGKGINNITFYEGTAGIPVGGWAIIMDTAFVHLKNYSARHNKGRGVVLQTNGGSLIEDSEFTYTNGVGVDITCDVLNWGEGNCGKDITLRNNTFNYVNQIPFRAHEIGDISIYATSVNKVDANPGAHSNITIEQNTFTGTVLYAVNAASVSTVVIRQNKFQSAGKGVLTICNATNIVAQYNMFMQQTNPNVSSLITFDSKCAPNSLLANSNNLLLAFAQIPLSTPAPTLKPSSAPTSKPSLAPTSIPTSAPTPKPTSAPTLKPSSAPTSKPTSAPTAQATSTTN